MLYHHLLEIQQKRFPHQQVDVGTFHTLSQQPCTESVICNEDKGAKLRNLLCS